MVRDVFLNFLETKNFKISQISVRAWFTELLTDCEVI